MKQIKKKIWMICIAIIAFSSTSLLTTSCASGSSSFYGEPVGINPYRKKKSNVVRSNIKVRDAYTKPNKKKRY
ncbi:MAG: hypothetical protein WC108_04090 [Bacteroidales bacterium]|jgi:hypothetical protein|nr:hypothetical protein [Bacteroidales bacterium]MDD4529193.1 hypothetical protein [Bacteroidales bacterium]MDD4829066.1 hypothetical protein [Bacteroidales bacterium]